jgi:long-subunit fatty acid transport protein
LAILRRMKRTLWLVAAGLALWVQSGRAHAQGFIIPELGSRVNGTGAAVGRPDDVSAIYQNPAALAELPGTQIGLSFGSFFLGTDIRLRPWSGSDKFLADQPVDAQGYYPRERPMVYAPVPFIGASTKLWSNKVTGALGIYVPNAAGASFGADQASRYHIIDAYLFSAYFTGAVAYKPVRWLSIGAGVSAVYVNVHRHQYFYPVIQTDPNDPKTALDLSTLIGKKTELTLDGSTVYPSFSFGIQAWPHRTVSLGFMLLSGMNIGLSGPLTVKLDPASLIPVDKQATLTSNQQRTEYSVPWIFGFGANWDITRWLEVGAEFRWYTNSVQKSQTTVITQGDVLKSLLPAVAPDRPDDHGLVTPKNLHDSYHVGGGFKVRPLARHELDLFTGFHFENSASPANTVEVSAPSFDLWALHLGARWGFHRNLRAALFYSHYWYLQRTTLDSITSPPTNFTGSAVANAVIVVLETRFGRGIGVR